jgi:hypothetical protein|tara:strand:- start:111 stop:545 length:435 start_codon:yes stop_codon:yes gene_type:complete
MQSDYLKYWRVIRQFIKVKYSLSQGDLDMILFLHSEKYFSKDKFQEFDELLSWDEDRFDRLLRDGWIQVFRKRVGKNKTLYSLSFKTLRVVSSIYKKLSGEEIPTSVTGNPMFAKNVSYTDKVYRNFIKNMNKFIRQQRHQTPE